MHDACTTISVARPQQGSGQSRLPPECRDDDADPESPQAILVVFMTGTAFSLWNSDNFIPLAPFGAAGVLKGAVAAFFGFLGYDEVSLSVSVRAVDVSHVSFFVRRGG